MRATTLLPLLALCALEALAAAPRGARDPAYANDAECARCHREAAQAWRDSHHARSMQEATPATVRGDFSGRELREGADTVRLFRRGKGFYARARDAGGRMRDHRVRYTFGVEPLQQYLVDAPGGRLQALTAAWDTGRRRWFSLDATGAVPGDALHWSGRYRNWNLMCAECHSTGVRKGYDAARDRYRSTWTAINVGCQACHGPGRAHATAARRGRPSPMPVDYSGGDPDRQIDQCARCHTVRSRLTDRDDPAAPFLDRYRPETLRPGLYHADGQQDGEVFEVGSFRQSRMHQAGVRCTDCHDPHAGKLRRPGDATCTACHAPAGDPRFPTAAGRAYDGPEHHFHAPGTPGSRCVDCHMPSRDYMVVHPRRDHAIRVPRPDLAARAGTPDACAACHADRGSAWAAEFLAARRRAAGEPPPGRHHGEAFAAARLGGRGAAPPLAALARDRAAPAILRATAAETLGQMGAAVPDAALSDPDGQVRAAAAGNASPVRQGALLAALLGDPLRAVRIAAARSLAAAPGALPQASRNAYARALDEYRAAQGAMADAPAARLSLGLLEEDLGRPAGAEAHYRAALGMDRHLVPARLALAERLAARGAADEAEALLREGLSLGADEGGLRRALAALRTGRPRGPASPDR